MLSFHYSDALANKCCVPKVKRLGGRVIWIKELEKNEVKGELFLV